MRITEIQLDGFGRLVNRSFQFTEGLNLIFGPNETGKSTLQRAIVAMLYGFFDRGRVKSADQEQANFFQPWEDEAQFGGSLTYLLDNQQHFLVKRSFNPKPLTTLFRHPQAQDISTTFKKDSQGRLYFAEEHLGMNKQVFENTCYIRQAELIALVDSVGAITNTLMRLSAAASTDTTATGAVALLAETFRERVGTDRARTKPLPRLIERLKTLELERSNVVAQRHELSTLTIELNQLAAKLHDLELQEKQLHYLETLATYNDRQQQLTIAHQVVAEMKEHQAEMKQWVPWANFPANLRDNVLKLSERRHILLQTMEISQLPVEQAEQERQSLVEKIKSLEEQINDLADARTTQTEALPEIQGLANQWHLARQAHETVQDHWQEVVLDKENVVDWEQEEIRLKPILELGLTGLAQLQQRWLAARERLSQAEENYLKAEAEWNKTGMTEEQLDELKYKAEAANGATGTSDQSPARGCKNLLGFKRSVHQDLLLPPPPVKIYEDLREIFNEVYRTRNERDDSQTNLAQVERDIYTTLGSLIGETIYENQFTELSQKLEAYQQGRREAEQQARDLERLQADLKRTQQQEKEARIALRTRLFEIGFEQADLEECQEAVEHFIQLCKQKSRLERLEFELDQLRLRSKQLTREIEKRRELEQAETDLCKLIAQADIECSVESLETALSDFEEGVENYQRWFQAQRAYETIASRQPTQPLDEQEKEVKHLRDELDRFLADHPEWADLSTPETSRNYSDRLRQIEPEIRKCREEYNKLETSITQLKNDFRHPAEIDEELKQVKEQIQALKRYGNLLEAAQTELTLTTTEFQKQFAPKLELLLSESLDRVTRGRYTKVHIDPRTLMVSLTAPELGQRVSADRLSTGTRELIYLMLRISIARLMSRTGEKLPLLLDDPLVQSDRSRQEEALAFLSRLAEETQIFLFTKDDWIRDWFEKHYSQLSTHKLHSLV